ncbi:uncharacterized protein LOC131933511, partial [Physella acuta]|uniref:uncharacterized protein LOC131933511 n=1 Tax=Physella acuta TaxID=109671 RepID=UPI0027DE3977
MGLATADPVLEDLEPPDEERPMSLWSCVFYVIANVIGMVLYWLYQQQRSQRLRQEESDYIDRSGDSLGVSSNLTTNYYSRQSRRTASQSSLLSILGISYNGYKTFYAFEDRFSNFDDVSW